MPTAADGDRVMQYARTIDDYASNGIMLYTKSRSGSYSGAFVCTSVDISYAIGTIPFAQVKVGAGDSLYSPSRHKQTPETILKSILGKKVTAYEEMVSCELWEAGENTSITNMHTPKSSKAIKIFDGYITAGCIAYEAGTYASKTITLSIYNKAIVLMASPLGALENVTSQYLTRILDAGGAVEAKQENQTGVNISDAGDIQLSNVLMDEAPRNNDSTTLDVRIANVFAKVIYTQTYNSTRSEISISNMIYREEILENIFSRYVVELDPEGIRSHRKNSNLAQEFDWELAREINGTLPRSSIFETLSSVVQSNIFMLTLCPRFRKDDFRLELCPSKAWNASKTIKLPLSKIININANYEPLASLQTPEAFLVSYGDSISMAADGTSTYDAGRPGVYALDPSVRSMLRQITDPNGTGSSALERIAKTFKVQRYNAPPWLHVMAKPQGYPDMVDLLKDGENEFSQANNAIYQTFMTGKAADCVAKALFTHIYGCNDTCSVSLSAELRFGHSGTVLEDHIGDCVDIIFDDSALSIRGMIDRIHYTYTCGKGRVDQSYGLSLSRVRPLDPSEPVINCPIYKRV